MKKLLFVSFLLAIVMQVSAVFAVSDDYVYLQLDDSGSRKIGLPNCDIALTGNGIRSSAFYLYSKGNASISFTQTKGTCVELNYNQLLQGISGGAQEWGKYEIEVVHIDSSAKYSYKWDNSYFNSSMKIKLDKNGLYYIYIRPFTQSEMNNSYLITQFGSWENPPEWWIDSTSNCEVSTEYFAKSISFQDIASSVTDGANKLNEQVNRSNASACVKYEYQTLNGVHVWASSELLTPGTYVVKPDRNFTDYEICGQSHQNVTVANGTAIPETVYFYLDPIVYVKLEYQTLDGTHLWANGEYHASGTFSVFPTKSFDQYEFVSQSASSVKVNNGVASPATVTFYYKAKQPSYSNNTVWVSINYYGNDGIWLSGSDKEFSPGTYTILPDFQETTYNNSIYKITGNQWYSLTVNTNGSANSTHFEFYYDKQTAGNNQPLKTNLDQTAVICKSPIFPRPGPNTGKNEYNYEVLGQTVTVHSKAKGQNGSSKWWICFSGELRCEGRVFSIDHQWISESYLDENSYDLYSLPLDPNY